MKGNGKEKNFYLGGYCPSVWCRGTNDCFVVKAGNEISSFGRLDTLKTMRLALDCTLSDDELRERIDDPELAEKFIEIRRNDSEQ